MSPELQDLCDDDFLHRNRDVFFPGYDEDSITGNQEAAKPPATAAMLVRRVLVPAQAGERQLLPAQGSASRHPAAGGARTTVPTGGNGLAG